nr:RNA-directed DNA polymerase, eukaryota [Tanacetum cinerariifolium]
MVKRAWLSFSHSDGNRMIRFKKKLQDLKRAWLSFSHSDGNRMIRFKKKLQDLKVIIRLWIKDKRLHLEGAKTNISKELQKIDKEMDSGVVSDTNRFRRLDLIRKLRQGISGKKK